MPTLFGGVLLRTRTKTNSRNYHLSVILVYGLCTKIYHGETYTAAMDTRMKDDHEFYPTIPVSFSFKRYDENDIRVLDEEFKDSKIFDGIAKSIDLRNDYETGFNSYFVTALRDSYEVRIKAEFGYFRIDFKVKLENFNEQYTWLTEVCKDEKIDVAVSVD